MRPANDILSHPTGPMMGFWSWRYLNFIKTLKLVTSKKVKDYYKKFPSIFPPGEKFPDFELKDIHGKPHRLSDYFGKKHILITTGAIT